MVVVDDLVSNAVSSNFSDADIINKVKVAYYHCSAIFGEDITISSGTVGVSAITVDDTQQGVAIALLAEAMLIEGRKTLQSKTNPTQVIRTTDELFTEEMRNMLLIGDATDDEEVSEGVMWTNTQPKDGWEA